MLAVPFFTVVSALASVYATPIARRSDEPSVIGHHLYTNVNGTISLDSGAPNGLYVYHNTTHLAYYGQADGTPSLYDSYVLDRRRWVLAADTSISQGARASRLV
jgi:hypothetical protein